MVLLGPFGKHDSLGQYPPPPDGARYDDPATFTEEEFKAELKGIVEWAQGLGASPNPPAHSHPSTACQGLGSRAAPGRSRTLPLNSAPADSIACRCCAGAAVLLATPIPFPFGSTDHTCATVVLPATQALAQELDLPVVDLYAAYVRDSSRLMLSTPLCPGR